MTRLPEKYGELQLLINILSRRVADIAVVQVGLAMFEIKIDEYIGK